MDKNTIIGIVLIVLIFFGFMVLNRPSEKEIARQKQYNDSIAALQTAEQQRADSLNAIKAADATAVRKDTAATADVFGPFAPAGTGTETFYTLENNLLKVTLSNKGGRIYSVQIKNYQTHDSLPLILFDKDESSFGFTLATNNSRVLNTKDLYFEPVNADTAQTKNRQAQSLVMRLHTSGNAYLDFVYTLMPNDYKVRFEIKGNNMASVLAANTDRLELNWESKIRQQEKGRKFEARYSGLFFKYVADKVDNLRQSGNDTQSPPNQLQWVSFKDQFFSSIFVADQAFFNTTLTSSAISDQQSNYLANCKTDLYVNYDPKNSANIGFSFYFVPNKYHLLKGYDKGVQSDKQLMFNKIIPLGWTIFGWINQYAIIPMFDFFGSFISNYGIIILLMTIVLRLVLFPLTYKSYMSSAKMRVLKPEIDEINAKIPKDKPLERQKATMDLYRKVGVSPMSGCLPAILQMPILIAMFNFFPASIELRHQSFLWAKDLSSYDAIISWGGNIPVITQYFGNHIALFCLLATAVTFIYTKVNMALQPSNQQMAGMQWMMYLGPFMMWFWFNDYASGLSYYYFLSTLISIGQTYVIRGFVDEKKLLAQLQANKKKPAKKKSSFMERMEKMQREQQRMQQQRAKQQKRR